ncbi:Uncharacterised protein [Klebsiella pneumoniae]|nr:Uncharacterised protein [Klebsiella pneumoniae]
MFSHSSRPNRRPRSYPTYKIPFAFFRSRTLCGMRMGPRRYSAWVSVVRVSSNISQSFGIRSGGRNLRSVNATISGGRMRMLSSMVKGRNRPSTVSMASRPNCTFGVRNHSMNEPSGRRTFLLSTDSCCIAAPGYSPIACCRRASSLTTVVSGAVFGSSIFGFMVVYPMLIVSSQLFSRVSFPVSSTGAARTIERRSP